MSSHPTDFKGSVVEALREAIERQIPSSHAEVSGGGGLAFEHGAVAHTQRDLEVLSQALSVARRSKHA